MIIGMNGNDDIYGKDGNDTMFGESTSAPNCNVHNSLDGGTGNDYVVRGSWLVTLRGGIGRESHYCGSCAGHLNGGVGDDIYVFQLGIAMRAAAAGPTPLFEDAVRRPCA